jgi:hypothetical protein
MVFILFNGYVVLEAAALAAFYVTAKPRHGRVRTAAIWHFYAACLLMVSFISTVWGAPAEKTFLGDATHLGIGQRAIMIFVGMAIAGVALLCMLIGFVAGGRQKRALREEVYAAA